MNPARPPLISLQSPSEALDALCAGFCSHRRACLHCQAIDPSSIPSPFTKLLIHHDHMTTRLADYYGRPVELRVLDHQLIDEIYRRKILLVVAGTEQVVELGVVRIDLGATPTSVREAILERRRPLGDILIQHDVLRHIEPHWYLKVSGGCPLLEDVLRHAGGQRTRDATFGRIGLIYCNGEPAIELLEIITGIDASPWKSNTNAGESS